MKWSCEAQDAALQGWDSIEGNVCLAFRTSLGAQEACTSENKGTLCAGNLQARWLLCQECSRRGGFQCGELPC